MIVSDLLLTTDGSFSSRDRRDLASDSRLHLGTRDGRRLPVLSVTSSYEEARSLAVNLQDACGIASVHVVSCNVEMTPRMPIAEEKVPEAGRRLDVEFDEDPR